MITQFVGHWLCTQAGHSIARDGVIPHRKGYLANSHIVGRTIHFLDRSLLCRRKALGVRTAKIARLANPPKNPDTKRLSSITALCMLEKNSLIACRHDRKMTAVSFCCCLSTTMSSSVAIQ